jgi:hypothetical protein
MPRKDIPSPQVGKRLKRTAPWGSWLSRGGKRPPSRPSGSATASVEPPRGPLPLQGGAEAPLEFDS